MTRLPGRGAVLWVATAHSACGGQTDAGTSTADAASQTHVDATFSQPASDAGGGAAADAAGDAELPPPDVLIPVSDANAWCVGATVHPSSPAAFCVYAVPPLPPGAPADLTVEVVYTATDEHQYLVPENRSGICDWGWHFIEDRTKFEFCGMTCDRIDADPGARIDVMLGCGEGGPLIM